MEPLKENGIYDQTDNIKKDTPSAMDTAMR